VGDDRARITADLRHAFVSGDLVFCCGGIGATPDDHTRQCARRGPGRRTGPAPRACDLILERMRDVAAEQGMPYEPDRADNQHRLNMGVFPVGAGIIPNPYNKIAGFSCGHVHFVPGFPVMAWPMIEWVLDQPLRAAAWRARMVERSVIVYGAMEATLTPLMEQVEAHFPGVKVFSLPSVDHPEHTAATSNWGSRGGRPRRGLCCLAQGPRAVRRPAGPRNGALTRVNVPNLGANRCTNSGKGSAWRSVAGRWQACFLLNCLDPSRGPDCVAAPCSLPTHEPPLGEI
jgi:molybdopterin-biosynthesis enzyme MoeA-like protein